MRGWATLTYNNSEKTALPCIFINPIETASTLKENIKQTCHLFFNSSQDKFYFVPAETRLIFWNKEAVKVQYDQNPRIKLSKTSWSYQKNSEKFLHPLLNNLWTVMCSLRFIRSWFMWNGLLWLVRICLW